MLDDATLLPPLPLIHERLTRNAKERSRLRTLLRLAVEARDDACKPLNPLSGGSSKVRPHTNERK